MACELRLINADDFSKTSYASAKSNRMYSVLVTLLPSSLVLVERLQWLWGSQNGVKQRVCEYVVLPMWDDIIVSYIFEK